MSDNDVIDKMAETSMSNEELNSIPSITPERDDINDRRGHRSFVARGSKVSASGRGAINNVSQNVMHGVLPIGLLALALLLALGGIVYLYQQLQISQRSLVATTQRVEQLEARLVSTDTTLTKSEVLLAAKLKVMDGLIDGNKTEIRKLWGASEKSSKTLQAQNTEIQQQKPILQGVVEQAQKTADQVATDGALLKSVDSTVKEAAQRMEIVQENLTDLSADTKSLKDKQLRLESDMGKRVTALEDTAKSTDVFRRNTQDELRKLREELSRPQPQPMAGAKPVP